MMTHQPSIADLCRPLSAKVQPALHRKAAPVGIAELVPPPRLRPITDGPATDTSAPDLHVAKSRHDPAVAAAREHISALYDGKRTTKRIAELTGLNRRTVFGHIRAMGLAPIKGQAGPCDDNPMRRKALARRATVKAMVAEGKSGSAIAEYLGVAISTIHADCIALKIRIAKGTGRKGRAPVEAIEAAAKAKRAKSRDARIVAAMAAFEKASSRAVDALKAIGMDQDDIAERMRAAVREVTV